VYRQRYNRISLKVLTPPASAPVTVADMEAYLVLGAGQDTGLLQSFIAAATDAMERYLRTSLATQTLRLTRDGFVRTGDDNIMALGPGVHTASVSYLLGGVDTIDLPRGPVQSVAQIVTFNRANQSEVFDPALYQVDAEGERVFLNEGVTWPDNLRDYAAVQVDYVAGYTDIPAAIVQGIKQHVAAMYECRSACAMPKAVQSVVDGYRRFDELGWR
jgi:hypothetical protein